MRNGKINNKIDTSSWQQRLKAVGAAYGRCYGIVAKAEGALKIADRALEDVQGANGASLAVHQVLDSVGGTFREVQQGVTAVWELLADAETQYAVPEDERDEGIIKAAILGVREKVKGSLEHVQVAKEGLANLDGSLESIASANPEAVASSIRESVGSLLKTLELLESSHALASRCQAGHWPSMRDALNPRSR